MSRAAVNFNDDPGGDCLPVAVAVRTQRAVIGPVAARAFIAALLATFVFSSAAMAHHTEGSSTHHDGTVVRRLDDGSHVKLRWHGDPRGLVSRAAALSSAMRNPRVRARASALATSWCGATRSTDDRANEVDPDSMSLHIVYAYPADRASRFGTYAPIIQQLVKGAADVVASTAGSGKTLRIDQGTSCGPQYIDITSIQLPHTAGQLKAYSDAHGGDSLSLLSEDVLGALNYSTTTPPRNTMIFADYHEWTNPTAGIAYTPSDDSSSISNWANTGGLSGAVFGWGPGWFQDPSYEYSRLVTLHETTHMLGAVADSAPHSTGAGHCYQEWDVMCYQDGGPKGQAANMQSVCTGSEGVESYDCGLDDYFNPSPQPGSYLATHWNVYSNSFLCSLAQCGQTSPPATLTLTAGLDRRPFVGEAFDVNASLDAGGTPVIGYLWDFDGDGVWDTSPWIGQANFYAGDTSARTIRVQALLADGRTKLAQLNVTAREEAPIVTAQVSATNPKAGESVRLSSVAGGDHAGIGWWEWQDNGEPMAVAADGGDYTWYQEGQHHITATAHTLLGGSATNSVDVSVQPAAVVTPPPGGTGQTGAGGSTTTTPTGGGGSKTTTTTGSRGTHDNAPSSGSNIRALQVSGGRRVKLNAAVYLKVRCSEGSTVTVSLRLAPRAAKKLKLRSPRLAIRAVTVASTGWHTVRLRLPARLMRLARGTKLPASLKVTSDEGDVYVRNVSLVR